MSCPHFQPTTEGFGRCGVMTSRHIISEGKGCSTCQKHFWKDGEPPQSITYVELLRKYPVNEPSLSQKVNNYIGSLVTHISKGGGTVSDEVYQARLKICQECPYHKDNRCTLCGCRTKGLTVLDSKLKMPHEQCPDNPPRWGPVSG